MQINRSECIFFPWKFKRSWKSYGNPFLSACVPTAFVFLPNLCLCFYNIYKIVQQFVTVWLICLFCIILDNRRGVFLQSNSQCRHEWVPWVIRQQGVPEKLQRVSFETCNYVEIVSTSLCTCLVLYLLSVLNRNYCFFSIPVVLF